MKHFSRRRVSGIIVMLILTGLSAPFKFQTVAASGTIYLRADGSVEGTDKIQRNGRVYTFIDDIHAEVDIERDNIVVDGAGYTLSGTASGTGIDASGRSNVTIKNVEIREFYYGIFLQRSTNITIYGSTITKMHINSGIGLKDSSCVNISENRIIENHCEGISITRRSHASDHHIISSNNITKNEDGIDIYSSSNNTISGNKINGEYGIRLRYSGGNNISRNLITDTRIGIDSGTACEKNVISENNFTSEGIGISFSGSSNNIISGNIMVNPTSTSTYYKGIQLLHSSNFNYIIGNTFKPRAHLGIVIESSNNSIYHNDFILTRTIVGTGFTNNWDDGYPSGGNYWSDYVCIGNPSDGSQPYVIDENNIDNYPFQNPIWLPQEPTPPVIVILSPQNTTYASNSIPLSYTISETTSRIGYSLNNQTIIYSTGNTTLFVRFDGSYSIIVNAIGKSGNMGFSDIVYFSFDSTPPVSDAGREQIVDVNEEVSFDATGSSDNMEIASYEWDFGDGTSGTGMTTTHTYIESRTYSVVLTVKDAAGNSNKDSVDITIRDLTAPTADAGRDQKVDVKDVVLFDATGSSDNLEVVSCEWDFGDGASGTGMTTTHRYAKPGIYTVTLTAEDEAGNTDIDSLLVSVEKKGCIIATTTYGSELSPEVQFLRGFRDNAVLKTFAGSSFMTIFNAWYYSFSPGVATAIVANNALRGFMKVLLHPLIGILRIASSIYSLFSFNQEVAVVISGLVASLLIGAVYLSPLTIASLMVKRRIRRPIGKIRLYRVLAALWLASVGLMLMGEVIASATLMMAASAAFVLLTLSVSAIITALVLVRTYHKLTI